MIRTGRLPQTITDSARLEKSPRRIKFTEQWLLHIIIIALLVLMLLPFAWMVGTSLKPDADATPSGLTGQNKDLGTLISLFWPREFHFENYVKAWNGKYSARIPDVSFFDAPFTR